MAINTVRLNFVELRKWVAGKGLHSGEDLNHNLGTHFNCENVGSLSAFKRSARPFRMRGGLKTLPSKPSGSVDQQTELKFSLERL